jgi:NhaP-type Na+/H+ or K+/H+ antiporter
MGAAIGYAAARLLHWARQRCLIEKYSYLTFTLAVSLCMLALGHLTGAQSLISIFVAGFVFDLAADTGEQHDEENMQEAIGKLATLPMFMLFGAALRSRLGGRWAGRWRRSASACCCGGCRLLRRCCRRCGRSSRCRTSSATARGGADLQRL